MEHCITFAKFAQYSMESIVLALCIGAIVGGCIGAAIAKRNQ